MPFTFCRRIDVGPSIAERVAIRQQEQEALRQSQALGVPVCVTSPKNIVSTPGLIFFLFLNTKSAEPIWHDFAAVADRFDPIDHIIDLNGHIIGMGLSPDHR